MFWLIAILLFFIVGVAAFELIRQDSGYVLLSLNGVTLETSFWFAIAVIVIVALCVYIVFFCINRVFQSMARGTEWFQFKRAHSIEKNYRVALLHYLTGDFSQASRVFSGLTKKSELPVVKAIASANSFFQSGDATKALAVLKRAEKDYPNDELWLKKAHFLLLLEMKEFSDAGTLLDEIKVLAPNEPMLKNWEYKVLRSDEKSASTLSLALDASSSLAVPDSNQLLLDALFSIVGNADNSTIEQLEKLWSKASKQQKADTQFQLAYTKALIALNEKQKAEKFIEKTLSGCWNAALVELYGTTEFSSSEKQLKTAESWKKRYTDKLELLTTLGVLSLKNQYWGQARSYLNASLELQQTPQALYLLGHVSEKLGEKDESFGYYKRSAELQKI